jgi:hypothetical protein
MAALSDSRARIWFALFVLVIFCLGGAGGFILGRHPPPFPEDGGPLALRAGAPRDRGPGRRGGPPFVRGPGLPGEPLGMPPEIAARLSDELQLDDAQRAQLHQVIDDRRPRFEQVHRDARDHFEAEQRGLRDAIRAFLHPDQIQRFDRFMNGRRP